MVSLFVEGREIGSYDFDEDLSDVEVGSTCSKDEDELAPSRKIVKLNDPANEDGDGLDDDLNESEDAISERSYDGSDADDYYELKELREDRKLELRQEKGKAYAFEKSKEVEVQSAYDATRFEKESPVDLRLFDPKTSNHFRIYSTDWVQHCFSSNAHASPYIEFYELGGNSSGQSSKPEKRQIHGHLYIHGSLDCDFKPFYPPQYASLSNTKLESEDGKYKITVQFFSHDYLKLQVSQKFFFQKSARTPKAPDFFEFVGIRRNREKERLEREMEAKKRKRAASPRDSWFERTHSMGSWC